MPLDFNKDAKCREGNRNQLKSLWRRQSVFGSSPTLSGALLQLEPAAGATRRNMVFYSEKEVCGGEEDAEE